ncbi:TPA: glycoside hydrolase domain-containing protein [Streptococcus suis]
MGNNTCKASHFYKIRQDEFKQSSGVFEVGNREWERPGSQEWKDVWGQVLQAYINHLDEKGWFEKAYLALDERPIPVIQEVLSLVRTYKNKDGKSLKVSAAIDYAAENKAILNQIDDISVSMGHISEPEDLRNYAQQRRESGKTGVGKNSIRSKKSSSSHPRTVD